MRAVGAAVPEGAGGQHGGGALRLRHQTETEPPGRTGQEAGLEPGRLHPGQFRDRLGLQQAPAVRLSAVEQHLVEFHHVCRGGEKPGPAQRRPLAVRHRAAVHIINRRFLEPARRLVAAVARRESRLLRRRRPERRVLHAEGIKQPLLHENGERPAADDLDDTAHVSIPAVE